MVYDSEILHSIEKEPFITKCISLANNRVNGRSQIPKQSVLYDSIYIKHRNGQS